MSTHRRITAGHPALIGNEVAYVNDCLKSSWISAGGPYVERFEKAFATFVGCSEAIATNNGTSALHVALVALGIGPGDEVIVPASTYIATINCVAYCGATPVFVDSVRPSLGLDPALVAAAITARTKAIIPVHLYGHPVEMDALITLAEQHGIFIVEDAAEAIGTRYRGKHVGALGTCGAFSFFGNKTITTGQGGMVTTNDHDLAARVRLFREQGAEPNRRYFASAIGFNYRMTNIEGAIGLGQIENIDYHLSARIKVARWYSHYLNDLQSDLRLPVVESGCEHSFWMYVVEFLPSSRIDRDSVIAELESRRVETRPGFFPAHTMPPYLQPDLSLPVANEIGHQALCLPTHALLSEDDVRHVAQQLREVLAGGTVRLYPATVA